MISFTPNTSAPLTARPNTKAPYDFAYHRHHPSTPVLSNSYNATLQRQYQRQQRRTLQLNSPPVYRAAASMLFCCKCRSDPSVYRRNRSLIWERFCVRPSFNASSKSARLKNFPRWKVFLVLVFVSCLCFVFIVKNLCSKWFTNGCVIFLFRHQNNTAVLSTSSHVSPETVVSSSYATTVHHLSQTLLPPEDDSHSGKRPLDASTRSPGPAVSMEDIPTWLTSYIEFHRKHVVSVSKRRGREEISTYRLNVSDAVRTLTYHCNGVSCGGLGDRFAGMIQAFYMAVCTNRVFLIDWHTPRDGRSLTYYIQPQWIQWNVANLNLDDETAVRAMDDRNNTFLLEPSSLPHDSNIRLETNLWMGENFIRSQCWTDLMDQHAILEGPPASSFLTEFQLYRTAFNTLFKWSPEVLQSMKSLRRSAMLVDSSNFVAMHIRSGLLDSKILASRSTNTHPQRHESPLEWNQFLQCSETLRKGIDNLCLSTHTSVVDLYLASDDAAVKEYISKTNSGVKMVSDLDIIHVDYAKTRNSDDIVAWSELVLLQNALCLVKSHSKYSETSAYLSVVPGCAVYFDDCSNETVAVALSNLHDHDLLQCTRNNIVNT